MEMSCSSFLDVLFEGQDETEASDSFSAAESKFNFPLPDHAYGCVSEKTYETWASSGIQVTSDSDAEDLFQLLIHQSDVYNSQSPVASPESDSGISDYPLADTPLPSDLEPPDLSSTVIYEVVCDTGVVEEAALPVGIFSGPLENWTPLTMLPEASVMNEVSPGFLENTAGPNIVETPTDQHHLQSVCLTDEERRLLSLEGVLLRSDLPLTKAEERILKKVRRKIRNKQSAQDSRRRKKEYIDGLENRVAACSTQNQELRKKIQDLEMHNMSLLDQLQKLQGLFKKTSTKAAQTSTCLLILIFSLGLFILPSCSSLFGGTQLSRDGYKPSGVISRNILNQGGLSELKETGTTATDDPESPHVQTEMLPEDPGIGDLGQGTDGGFHIIGGRAFTNRYDLESPKNIPTQPKESSLAKEKRPEADKDSAKQIHADEM
ncbi:cyclic AMP-responsive element-binding protein 3-like protein 4 [Sceloporus undulatus]|uniref:cyclic AMP-responsive element-binding protein 3-like protein 4 n=1 Tax=Sceloporus undulatus TaxID=8520 RepID=UPI001C4AAC0A|nr:cyclic AMP-responsive element-binding protein 3-like protein 4 [Sceloporus undulatus]